MKTIYIKESTNNQELITNKKIPKMIKNIIIKIVKKFNIIKRNKIGDDILYIIPNLEDKKLQEKLKNKLENEDKNFKIVFSYKLEKIVNIDIKQKIIKGKQVLKYMVEEVLNYIFDMDNEKEKIEFQDIYILQKYHSLETIDMIEYLLNKVRMINIITNQVNKYKALEEKIYLEGYTIAVSNNKKKALKRARIILNMDFTKEDIIKFNINRNAIIINLTNEKIDNLIGFDGIIVNNIKINMSDKQVEEFKQKQIFYEFDQCELYESILKSGNFLNQINKIRDNKIKIESLIGNNGKITQKEIILKKKILTNTKN